MAGTKALRKIQIGAESTAGTAVAATTILRQMGVLEDRREVRYPAELIGNAGGDTAVYIPKYAAALVTEPTEATFEQLPYYLEAGVDRETPTQDGAGSDYIYAYNVWTTSLPNPRTYTIEGGDNQQAEEMEYSYVEELVISGVAGEAVMMSGTWIGRQVSKTSFTGALSVPTVEHILASKGKIYIDAVGGTIGNTQVSDTLLGFELRVATGIIAKFSMDGNEYFEFIQFKTPVIALNLTYEHNASAVTEKDAWIAKTPRQIRLEFEGSEVATPGTTYTYKTLRIDLAGVYEKFDPLGDQDENDILTCTFRAKYDSTAALFAEFLVVNELSALP